jgi:hypothetical protein
VGAGGVLVAHGHLGVHEAVHFLETVWWISFGKFWVKLCP